MIVVAAVQNGSGLIRSASSGATVELPGLSMRLSAAEPRSSARRSLRSRDTAIRPDHLDSIIVHACCQATALNVIVTTERRIIQMRGHALYFANGRRFLRPWHDQAVAVFEHNVVLGAGLGPTLIRRD